MSKLKYKNYVRNFIKIEQMRFSLNFVTICEANQMPCNNMSCSKLLGINSRGTYGTQLNLYR